MRRDPGLRRRRDRRPSCDVSPTSSGRPRSAPWAGCELLPNLVNVVPSPATLTVDLRNTDDAVLAEAERRLAAFCDEVAAAEGVTIERALAGPLRAGHVRRPRRRPRRASVAAEHGRSVRRLPSGRRPRRPDAGPGVPGRHGLRAERRRHQPQPQPSTPTPTTSPPAPTCCSRCWLAALAERGSGRPGGTRHLVHGRAPRRWGRSSATTPARTSSSGCSSCCTRAHAARVRPRRLPRAGAHHVLPPLVRRRRGRGRPLLRARDARTPTRSRCSTRPARLGVGLLPRLRRAARRRRPPLQQRRCSSSATDGSSRTYRKVHIPGHEEHEPVGRSSTSSATTSSPAPTASACGGPSAASSGMMICNDRRWPETYRVMGLQGVELILMRLQHADPLRARSRARTSCRASTTHLVMQAGAYQNGTWVVGVAKGGVEEGVDSLGQSCIIAPSGQIVAQALTTDDELIVAPVRPRLVPALQGHAVRLRPLPPARGLHAGSPSQRGVVDTTGGIVMTDTSRPVVGLHVQRRRGPGARRPPPPARRAARGARRHLRRRTAARRRASAAAARC